MNNENTIRIIALLMTISFMFFCFRVTGCEMFRIETNKELKIQTSSPLN